MPSARPRQWPCGSPPTETAAAGPTHPGGGQTQAGQRCWHARTWTTSGNGTQTCLWWDVRYCFRCRPCCALFCPLAPLPFFSSSSSSCLLHHLSGPGLLPSHSSRFRFMLAVSASAPPHPPPQSSLRHFCLRNTARNRLHKQIKQIT